mmetsp:Transcript_46245/g.150369  ORF Transcript_46245/g.150369 Transcript_46245/m.150369 type:complete len:208 (-) Transcript_46245:254-877(-)
MPRCTAMATMRRQPAERDAISAATAGSSSRLGSAGSRAYAARTISSTRARMMQPPRQMTASCSSCSSHPCSREAAESSARPCAYLPGHVRDTSGTCPRAESARGVCTHEQSRAARRASSSASAQPARGSATLALGRGAGVIASAATRCSLREERKRASSAAAIVAQGTPSSAACCTVHLPVPFEPHESRIASTSSPAPLPGASSLFE